MKVTTIAVSFGATVNTGNFNSLRVDVQLTAQVDGEDDVDQVIADLHAKAKTAARDQLEGARRTTAGVGGSYS